MILLIEDDKTIVEGLKYYFGVFNLKLDSASTINNAKNIINNEIPELIILDVTLPDGNGFALYNKFIREKNIPTIFLTARDTEDDIVKGLELGADDYITKPFSNRELFARVKRILLKNKNNTIIEHGNIKFDLNKMEVLKDSKIINFTSLEFRILELLILNLNKVVTRNYIIDKVYEWTGNDVNDNTITVYLKRIRDKLGADIIKTIKGVGYRIDEK